MVAVSPPPMARLSAPMPTMPTTPMAGLCDVTISVVVVTGTMPMPVAPMAGLRDVAIPVGGVLPIPSMAGLRDVAISVVVAKPGDPKVRSILPISTLAAAFPP